MQITSLAIVGQTLLWIGFLGGALASVFRLENKEAPWSTIPWEYYAAATAVGVVGVVLLQLEKAKHRRHMAGSEAGLELVEQNLRLASERVHELANRLSELTCEDVIEYIDEQCALPLADFAEGRLVITNQFGTATYAAVMTEFASGERYLNRAWSAAADGYVDEVERSARHASAFLSAAEETLNQAIHATTS